MTRFAALTAAHVGSRRIRSLPIPPGFKPRYDRNAAYMNDPVIAKAFDDLERFCRERPDLRPTKHESIGGRDYLAWFAVAFATGCILYFAGQLLRAVL